MQVCVLGSGSSGNSTVVRLGGRALLIDAGFGPRAVAKRLDGTGVTLNDIDAVLLTHLDRDHFNPNWFSTLLKRRITVYVHRRHERTLYRHRATTVAEVDARSLHNAGLLRRFTDQPFTVETALASSPARVTPIHLAHDRSGTVGFRIDSATGRLGFATDLGRVPGRLLDLFADVDVLAIESNYDPQMQMASPRPQALINRIMNGAGHLSNDEAYQAVCAVIERSKRLPHSIVLLHLSRQCNCPSLVRRLYDRDPRFADRLCITSQSQRTDWLSAARRHAPLSGEQLSLF